jgi:hypothetical protein
MSVNEFLRVPSIHCFSEIVQTYETVHKETDKTYINSINRMKETNLKSLNQKDVQSILNPFLLKWGNMARVLGFAGCIKIGEVLKEMNEELFDVRYYFLQDDLEKVSNVAELYDNIMNAQFKSTSGLTQAGSTAASKALHLIAPDFFVMWDNDIRKYSGFGDTGKEYQRFMANMKYRIECLNPTVTALSEKFGKTKTKIIDEYNWFKFRY